MKKLIALFLILALSAGFTTVHALYGNSGYKQPVLTETEEITEEEFISVLTSSHWSYSNPVKKNTVYLNFKDDGTAIMKTGDITYDMTWEMKGRKTITAEMEAEGITYIYHLKLILSDGKYALQETSHREMVWVETLF